MPKMQLAIAGINYILNYIKITLTFYIVIIFQNEIVFNLGEHKKKRLKKHKCLSTTKI